MVSPWIDYNKYVEMPHPQSMVMVRFKNDGHVTVPIKAADVDWTVDHRDPVEAFQIVQPYIENPPKSRKQENA